MIKWCSYWVLVAFFIAGCDKTEEEPSLEEKQRLEIQKYIVDSGQEEVWTYDEEAGFAYKVIAQGVPSNGDVYSIFYSIRDFSGDPVDDNIGAEPIRLKRENGSTFPLGLEEAIKFKNGDGYLMSEGGIYEFIFPSSLAYMELGLGLIEPNAIAIIEITVERVEQESDIFTGEAFDIQQYIEDNDFNKDPDSLINAIPYEVVVYKTRLSDAGEEVSSGGTVNITVSSCTTLAGSSVPFESPEAFIIGEEILIKGLELGLQQMKVGEVAKIIMTSRYAYGASVQTVPHTIDFKNLLLEEGIIPEYGASIEPYTPLVFEVEVLSIE